MSEISNLSLKQLQEENARLLALIAQKESTIENLQHQLHLFRTARFGRKSEKDVVAEQLSLQFDEAVPAQEIEPAIESQTETITYKQSSLNI